MKFAAIDIGSNAARLQITKLYLSKNKINTKKIEYVRFPLRLGMDVFTMKRITPKREENTIKLLHSFKLLMELHEVQDYMLLSTSAMREAENGKEIQARVKKELDLDLQIITGDQESEYVNMAFLRQMDNKNYLHIDVGGGSTEISIFSEKKQIISKSFPVGSIRLLEDTVEPQIWNQMQAWVEENIKEQFNKLSAIGIGGNINKIVSIINNKDKNKTVSLKDIENLQKKLENTTITQRIVDFSLNPDRADVIIPASTIYSSVMKWTKVKEITTPGLGLKDGIIEALIRKYHLDQPDVLQRSLALK